MAGDANDASGQRPPYRSTPPPTFPGGRLWRVDEEAE